MLISILQTDFDELFPTELRPDWLPGNSDCGEYVHMNINEVALTQEMVDWLLQHDQFLKCIEFEEETLINLLKTDQGRHLLWNSSLLRGQIPGQHLRAVWDKNVHITDDEQQALLDFLVVSTQEGHTILRQRREFNCLWARKRLETMVPHGDFKGMSFLFYLVQDNPVGVSHLDSWKKKDWEDMCGSNYELLYQVAQDGPYKGQSVLFWMLKHYDMLFSKEMMNIVEHASIDVACLSAIVEQENNSDESSFFWLLMHFPQCAQAYVKALNHEYMQHLKEHLWQLIDRYPQKSVLAQLLLMSFGLQWVMDNSLESLTRVTADVLSKTTADGSTVFFKLFATDTGYEIVEQCQSVLLSIKNKATLFDLVNMLVTPIGQQILNDNPAWWNQLSSDEISYLATGYLNAKITQKEALKEQTYFSLLLSCDVGQKILMHYSVLWSKVSVENLCVYINETAGSVSSKLLTTTVGQQILLANSALLANIRLSDLDQRDVWATLLSTKLGRSILENLLASDRPLSVHGPHNKIKEEALIHALNSTNQISLLAILLSTAAGQKTLKIVFVPVQNIVNTLDSQQMIDLLEKIASFLPDVHPHLALQDIVTNTEAGALVYPLLANLLVKLPQSALGSRPEPEQEAESHHKLYILYAKLAKNTEFQTALKTELSQSSYDSAAKEMLEAGEYYSSVWTKTVRRWSVGSSRHNSWSAIDLTKAIEETNAEIAAQTFGMS